MTAMTAQAPLAVAPLARRRRNVAQDLVPADLVGIGLEEMVSRAAMLTRVDRKYALPAADLPGVVSNLDADTRVLEINGRRAHAYRSTYFDTPDLASFRGTAHPRRRRFKVRTRTYVESDISFLEVKTRGPRGNTVKERIPVPPIVAAREQLGERERRWVASRLDPIGHAGIAEELHAVLRGGYNRTTLLMPDGGRATIDTDLVWELVEPREGSSDRVELPDLVIVETKSGSTPSRLDHLLWSRGHRPTRVSKYATAMAALNEDLPSNRWTQTLKRHF